MDKTKAALLAVGFGLGAAGSTLVSSAFRPAIAAEIPGVHAFDVRQQPLSDGGMFYNIHAYGHVITADGGFVDLNDVPWFTIEDALVKPLHDRVVAEWTARKFPDAGL